MGHCEWDNINEITKKYHDKEWGIPVHDDLKMFEHLTFISLLKKNQTMKVSGCKNYEY